MRALGMGLGFVAILGFALGSAGYAQSLARTPWAEPLKWTNLDPQQRSVELHKFRQRNAQWRPKFAFAMLVSLALFAVSVALFASS